MLTFNAERHEYRWQNRVVPSVTQLLQGLHSFAGVPLEVLEAARERGTAVHSACHFYDEDDLDEDVLRASDPEVWAYLQGWKAFLRDCEPNWSQIEQPLYEQTLGYAGTADRIGEVRFKPRGTLASSRIAECTVDIKTAATSHPVWGIQTAAYKRLTKSSGPRMTIQLEPNPEGRYRLIEWTDPGDWPVFVSLVTLHHWGQRTGRQTTGA